jgi:hypothetical protein
VTDLNAPHREAGRAVGTSSSRRLSNWVWTSPLRRMASVSPRKSRPVAYRQNTRLRNGREWRRFPSCWLPKKSPGCHPPNV